MDPKYLPLSGHKLAYLEKGQGEPILFLHGYPQNHAIWSHHFEHLSNTHRVIAPDLLGWGASDRPTNVSFTYDADLSRVFEFIDRVVGPKFNLVGHDYGGFLSTGIACKAPERVLRLALMNTRAHSTFPPLWYFLLGLTSVLAWISRFIPIFHWMPLESQHRRMLSPLKGKIPDSLHDAYLGQFRDKDFLHWLRHFYGEGYRVAVRRELREGIKSFRSPLALIWGKNDPYFPVRIAQDLKSMLPHASLTILDCGHFPAEEEPAQVLEELRKLLALPTAN